MQRLNVFDEFEAVLVGQRHVHQHEIGLQLRNRFHCLARRAGLAAHHQVLFAAQQITLPAPHERMVVHQQNLFELRRG